MAHRAASPAEAAKGAITRDESNATARPRPALPSQHQGVAAAGGVIAGCWSGVATIATVAQGEAGIASPAISPRRFRGRHRAACMRAAVGRSSGSWTRGWIAPTASNLTYWPSLPGTGRIPVRSEEHTSELQSLMRNSYAVFCLKKKTIKKSNETQLQL